MIETKKFPTKKEADEFRNKIIDRYQEVNVFNCGDWWIVAWKY